MIRVELAGSGTATALGLTAQGRTPVLSLCRQLVAAGHDPAEPAQAYCGTTLALHIRSIGEAAKLAAKEDPSPRFAPFQPFPADRVRPTGVKRLMGWDDPDSADS